MNPPVNISQAHNQIYLDWLPITTDSDIGRDPIIYYSLEWFNRLCYTDTTKTCTMNYDPGDGSWLELTSFNVNPLALEYKHNTTTHFPANLLFSYRVRAKNGVGLGEYSLVTLVITDDVPLPMRLPNLVKVRA